MCQTPPFIASELLLKSNIVGQDKANNHMIKLKFDLLYVGGLPKQRLCLGNGVFRVEEGKRRL